MNEVIIHPDVQLLSMAIGLFLPLITGIVTKLRAGSAVKAAANAVLAVVTGLASTWALAPEAGIPVVQSLYAIAFAFVSSVATYAHIWKPIGVTDKVQQATSGFGVGGSTQ